MMLSLEARLIAVFTLLSAIALLLAWRTHVNSRNFQNSFRSVEHTDIVLLTAEELASRAKDIERSARGYIITYDSAFLKTLPQFRESVSARLNTLKSLTAGNLNQKKKIDSLEYYLDKRIGFIQQQLAIQKEQGFDAAKRMIQSGRDVDYMDNTLKMVAGIQQEERARLADMRTSIASGNRAFNRWFFSLIALLITVLFIFFIALYFSYKKRIKAETQLIEHKEILQSIIENTSSIVYIKDLQGRFTLVNKQFEKAFNVTRDFLIGKTVFDFCPPAYAVKYTEADQVVLQQNRLIEVEEDGVIDGQLYNYYSIKFPLHHPNGEIYALCGISTNITEIISRQQLVRQREIAETTILAQEKERTEIGKELHDNVNQLLATARLMIETSRTMPEMQEECLQISKEAIEDAIKEIRAISHSMLPPAFENESFIDAIKDIANNLNISGNLKVLVQMPEPERLGRINDKLKLSLYRIIQEQVTNTLKYSKAKNATITLEVKNGHAHLSIVDNGVGADMDKQPKGVGLRNIASRVEIHNGELKIKTAPDQGFGLFARFLLGNQNGQPSKS